MSRAIKKVCRQRTLNNDRGRKLERLKRKMIQSRIEKQKGHVVLDVQHKNHIVFIIPSRQSRPFLSRQIVTDRRQISSMSVRESGIHASSKK